MKHLRPARTIDRIYRRSVWEDRITMVLFWFLGGCAIFFAFCVAFIVGTWISVK